MIKDLTKTPEGKQHMEYSILLAFSALLLFLIVISVAATQIRPVEQTKITVKEVRPNPFHDVEIEARAAYAVDLNTGEVYFEKNAESQLPLASLTKLITAITAIELIPDYTLVAIDRDSLKKEGDSGFQENEKFTLLDLIRAMLVSSSNDGASAIAGAVGAIERGKPLSSPEDSRQNESAFVEKMNSKTRALGLKQTFILNSTGLDTSEATGGGYGSARDMSKLFSYILRNHPELIEPTRNEKIELSSTDKKSHIAKNTNTSIQKIPGLLGSKTGFTDLAGGNLVIAFDAGINKPIIISVLGSSESGRFEDVNKLVWTTLAYLKSRD